MHIDVNGTRLWFDLDGSALVLEGKEMRQRPTVLLIRGGPGTYDHSYFKPDFGRLADHAQVVYLDLRGHGRSDWGDTGAWSFETCADDVRMFCDALGIARPIVLGHSMADRSSFSTVPATPVMRPGSLFSRDCHGGTPPGWSRGSAASRATM